MTSPKSVRAARWLTSGDPRKSAISGKRRRFSATTSLPICQAFWPDPARFRSTTPRSASIRGGPDMSEYRLSWKITADAVLSAKAKPKQRTGREVADTSWAAP